MTAPHFVERRDCSDYWLVDAELEAPLAALGWPAWPAVERALGTSAASGRTATAILSVPGVDERLHLRPVRHGGLLGGLWLGAIAGVARPVAELRATAALFAVGAPVPRPALVVARRIAGPFWSAVLATRHVEDARDGLAWLATRPAAPELERGARAAGAAIRRFHDAGGSHADLHAKNLLFRARGAEPEVLVIDLDGARTGAPPDPARRCAELMRVVRGLHKRGVADQVGARGCAAAFSAYCAGDRALRRALIAHLPSERRRLARHARLYR